MTQSWQQLEEDEKKFDLWMSQLDARLAELERLTTSINIEQDLIPKLLKSLSDIEKEVEDKYIDYAGIASQSQKISELVDPLSLVAVEVERKLVKISEEWDASVHRIKNIGVALTTAVRLISAKNSNRDNTSASPQKQQEQTNNTAATVASDNIATTDTTTDTSSNDKISLHEEPTETETLISPEVRVIIYETHYSCYLAVRSIVYRQISMQLVYVDHSVSTLLQ